MEKKKEQKTPMEKRLSRRGFLTTSGGVAVGLGLSSLLPNCGSDERNPVTVSKGGQHPDDVDNPKPENPNPENPNPGMPYRRLGRTDLMVSAISFGGAFRYGPGALNDTKEIQRMLDQSLDLGINYFDTAPQYLTEGDFAYLAPRRDEYFLATKVTIASPKLVRPQVEMSLAAMKTDYLDVIQTHNHPETDEWSDTLETLQELHKLKEEGKVRFVGFTHHSHDALKTALQEYTEWIDLIMLMYNFHSDTDGAHEVISLADKKDIGTIAMKVFRSALQTWEERVERFQGDAGNWERLNALMDGSTSVAQACIKYVLKNPLLSTALLGMQSVQNVQENASMAKMLSE